MTVARQTTDSVAIVLSCAGAPEGSLGAVRGLGMAGVPVYVLSEVDNDPASSSRYCIASKKLPPFSSNVDSLLAEIREIAQRFDQRPVVLPSADPDLHVLSAHADELREHVHVVAPDFQTLTRISDKVAFSQMARELHIPVPRTFSGSPDQLDAICGELRFPVVVKPASFAAWNETGVSAARNKKALIIDEASDLLDLYSKLYAENPSQLVQEFVVGPDNLHYDVLLYIDDKGKLLGSFSARKPRVSPPHAGTGCYIESQRLPGLIDDSFEYCRRLGYSGLANLQYKRDQRTGEFLLLEINPRLVEWNIFAARCGVNLAKLAYMGVLGQPVSALQNQIAPRFFCNMRKDLPAMRALVKEGLLTPLDCGRSIIRPGISFQLWDRRDPNPFLQKLKVAIGKRLGFAHAKP